MVLAEVHRQVGQTTGGRAIRGEEARAARPARPVEHLHAAFVDKVAQAERPDAGRAGPVVGIAVDLGGGCRQRRGQRPAADRSGPEVRQQVGGGAGLAGSARRRVAVRARSTPSAPPYQHAATPADPAQKPGRSV